MVWRWGRGKRVSFHLAAVMSATVLHKLWSQLHSSLMGILGPGPCCNVCVYLHSCSGLCGTLLCWWWCCCLQTTVLQTLWVLMALVFVAVLQIAQAAALWVLMWWPPVFAVLQTAQADSSFGAACYRQATRKSFQKSWTSGNFLALFVELGSRILISTGCIRDSSPRRYCKLQRRFMDCCQWCTAGSC